MSLSTFALWLTKTDEAERIALLPPRLRSTLGELFEAICDLTQEAHGSPYGGGATEPNIRVQKSDEESVGGVAIRNSGYVKFMVEALEPDLYELRTEIRALLAQDRKPRRGPRFTRPKRNR